MISANRNKNKIKVAKLIQFIFLIKNWVATAFQKNKKSGVQPTQKYRLSMRVGIFHKKN